MGNQRLKTIKTVLKSRMDPTLRFCPDDEYVLVDKNDNLFEPMGPKHEKEILQDGKNKKQFEENPQHLRTVTSSSALTFNLFGNLQVGFLANPYFPSGIYSLEYEKHLRCGFNATVPVKLDAFLVSQNGKTAVAVESKMTEWTENLKSPMTGTYLKSKMYSTKELADVFIPFLQRLKSPKAPETNCKGLKMYESTYSRLDVFQLVRHMMGLYQSAEDFQKQGIEDLTMMLLVWRIPPQNIPEDLAQYGPSLNGMYETLLREAREFTPKFEACFRPHFQKHGIDFHFFMTDYSALAQSIDMSPGKKEYLSRYMIL